METLMKNDKARLVGAEALAPAREPGGLVSGLECRVGKAPIVVPIEHVAQIIEYELSPLPLTRRWIAGVGLYDERLVMTVGLVADTAAVPTPERRLTKGILLNLPSSKIAWALEVQEVLVLVRAAVIEQRPGVPRAGDLPPWITRARTNDGRSIAWIDVPAMLADLGTAPRSLA
jgi:chemotaxis signal transduction protein